MIAQMIKKLRTSNGLTQEEFSGQVGISRNALINYENNHRVPPIEVLQQISQVFDVDISMFFDPPLKMEAERKETEKVLKSDSGFQFSNKVKKHVKPITSSERAGFILPDILRLTEENFNTLSKFLDFLLTEQE